MVHQPGGEDVAGAVQLFGRGAVGHAVAGAVAGEQVEQAVQQEYYGIFHTLGEGVGGVEDGDALSGVKGGEFVGFEHVDAPAAVGGVQVADVVAPGAAGDANECGAFERL